MNKFSKLFFSTIFAVNIGYAGLVAEYTFEQNNVGDTSETVVPDESGSGNNAKLREGATVVEPGADGSNKAFRSSSTSKPYDSVVAPDSESLSITGDLTISLWVKPSDIRYSGLVTKTLGSDTHNVEYWFSMRGAKLTFVDNGHDDQPVTTDNDYLEKDKWHHVALVRDSAQGKLHFYVDGELKETKDWEASSAEDTGNGIVVGACDPCEWPFVGDMDCVRIYNEALDADGIKASMKCSLPAHPKIDIEKATNGKDADSAGGADVPSIKYNEDVAWTYVVTNTGDVDLKNIIVKDDKEGNVTDCKDKDGNTLDLSSFVLKPNEKITCTKIGKADTENYENNGSVVGQHCVSSGGGGSETDVSNKITNPSFGEATDAKTVDGWNYSDGCYASDSYQGEPNKDGKYHAYSSGANKYCGQDVAIDSGKTYKAKLRSAIHSADEGKGGFIRVVYLDSSHNPISSSEHKVRVDDGTCTLQADGGKGFCIKEFNMGTAPANAAFIRFEGNSGSGEFTKVDKAELFEVSSGSSTENCTDVKDSDLSHYNLIKKACLGDFVWDDTNKDGKQDNGEPGVDGVKVYLLDENGNRIADKNTTTANGGKYEFCDLEEGKYSVEFDLDTIPDGYVVTSKGVGADDKDSDADPATGKVDYQANLKAGDNDKTLDMGIYKTPCLGDFVWEDRNRNGKQDAGEPGIDGVKVYLLDENGNRKETTTVNGGKYKFCNLQPGKYKVKFDLTSAPLDGYRVTKKDEGDDAKDSDADESTGVTAEITIDKDDNYTLDMGVHKKPCLGDFVWEDRNRNGKQDAGEPGIEGVKVALYKNGVATGDTSTTDADGKYKFCELEPGNYSVKFSSIPEDKAFTKQNEAADDVDSDANPDTGMSDSVEIDRDDNMTVDAGLVKLLCIGDYVWEDTNADGQQDTGEPGIDGVKVTLTMPDGTKKETTTKDGGKYSFCKLEPNKTYKVTFGTLSGYTPTTNNSGDDAKDSDPENGEVTVQLGAEDDLIIDAGFFKPACIGNFVWYDKNANGKQDGGSESGVAGAKVELFDGNDQPVKDINNQDVAAQTTQADGEYKFCDLKPGNYYVKITPPSGYYISPKDSDNNNDDTKDSDIDPSTGKTEVTTLDNGEDDDTWDAGLFKPACIGDYIWDDKNANGIEDDNEIGVKGVIVELVYANGNSVVDVNGNTVEPKETNATGGYKFCNLRPNSYKVKATMPEGYYTTKANVENNSSNDAIDSDFEPVYNPTQGETKEEILISGENNTTLDGGIFQTACVGSAVWLDKNGNGIQEDGEPGIANVTITLLKEDGDSNITNVKGEQIEEFVTSEDGKYQFCDLLPGTYRVKFEAKPENGAPYISTGSKKGDENNDSDIPEYILNGGVTEPIILKGGDSYQAVKAGFINEICLGGNMWYDENLNGILDEDKSVMDVAVYLYEKDGKTIAKDIYGNPIKAIKTNKDGKYKFCHIQPARDYVIKFDTPKGYLSTTKDRGSNDTIDSELLANSTIYVKHPVKDDLTQNSGIYCECDDYNVHPENYKKLKAPSMTVAGVAIVLMILTLIAIRKTEEA